MKIKTAIVVGLLCAAGVAGAADPMGVADPEGALEDAAKDAVIEAETIGVPEDTLDKAKETKEAVGEAQETAADPDAATEELKNQGTETAIEKAQEAIPAPKVPKLPY